MCTTTSTRVLVLVLVFAFVLEKAAAQGESADRYV